jgi:2-polyprenyl-6-methoxyphenol hydroxylase-like FAD-dependent oxidoreductase
MAAAIANALIVGGGTAGLCQAIVLRRLGIDAEIVEVKRDWTVLGSGVTMMGATLRALDEIGLGEECARRGAGGDSVGIYDGDGNELEIVPVAQIARPGLPAVAGIMRPELHRMLVEAAEAEGTQVRLGTTVESLAQDADGVDVRTSDGAEKRYDLVLAADGIHSEMRERLWGPGFAPHYTEQIVWRAVVPRPADYTEVAMFYGAHHKSGINAVSATEAYLFLAVNTADTERPPREEWPAILRGYLEEFGGPIVAIREAITEPDTIDCRPLQANLVPKPWHKGRVLLVGDAAHASTPQLAMGAGLAVEDAVVLGDLLAGGAPVDEVLPAFAERRFDRCRMVVENSVQLGEWEKDHTEDADPGGLSASSWAALAEAI